MRVRERESERETEGEGEGGREGERESYIMVSISAVAVFFMTSFFSRRTVRVWHVPATMCGRKYWSKYS